MSQLGSHHQPLRSDGKWLIILHLEPSRVSRAVALHDHTMSRPYSTIIALVSTYHNSSYAETSAGIATASETVRDHRGCSPVSNDLLIGCKLIHF